METKQCFKCKQVLPLTEFYAHPQMGDGHLGKCKSCTKGDVTRNREDKRQQYSEYEAERTKTSERRAKRSTYQRVSRQRNKEKHRARRILGYAVRTGKVTRQPCIYCGNSKVNGHHHDYSKPLDVTWVCFRCHQEKIHGRVVVSSFGGD